MDQIKIGSFIKELRKEQNLTQEELAEKFGVARRTVSRWETGSNGIDGFGRYLLGRFCGRRYHRNGNGCHDFRDFVCNGNFK